MVIRSKLEHEIEHQPCLVDSAHVMFPFLSQKRYQIDETTVHISQVNDAQGVSTEATNRP